MIRIENKIMSIIALIVRLAAVYFFRSGFSFLVLQYKLAIGYLTKMSPIFGHLLDPAIPLIGTATLICGIMIILGFKTRLASAVMVIVAIYIACTALAGGVITFAFYILLTVGALPLVLFIFGGGAFSLSRYLEKKQITI